MATIIEGASNRTEVSEPEDLGREPKFEGQAGKGV